MFVLLYYGAYGQMCKTGLYERIDTIVIFDPETHVEVTRIEKAMSVYFDANQCDSLPDKMIAKTTPAKLSEVSNLASLEFRCGGLYQRPWEEEWKIESFKLVKYRANKRGQSILNVGSEFSKETKEFLRKLNSKDILGFVEIKLVHVQKGRASGEFKLKLR